MARAPRPQRYRCGRFLHAERTESRRPRSRRRRPRASCRIWNGNWQVRWNGSTHQTLTRRRRALLPVSSLHPAEAARHSRRKRRQPESRRRGARLALHFLHAPASGTIALDGRTYHVSASPGWITNSSPTSSKPTKRLGLVQPAVRGRHRADAFPLRRKDGSIDPFSAGTFIDAQGKSHHLTHTDFTLTSLGDSWKSPVTSATYPVRWKIFVPKLVIELEADTALKSQELTGQSKWIPNYWEGAISVSGHRETSPLQGVGYLEMTGYDRAVVLAH